MSKIFHVLVFPFSGVSYLSEPKDTVWPPLPEIRHFGARFKLLKSDPNGYVLSSEGRIPCQVAEYILQYDEDHAMQLLTEHIEQQLVETEARTAVKH